MSAKKHYNIQATHEPVASSADATATTNGLGASTNSYASNDFDVETRILTETATELHAPSIEVDATADTTPTDFTDPTSNGALIHTASQHNDNPPKILYLRTI